MSNNLLNLGLRFVLELVGLYAIASWGLNRHEGVLQWVVGLGLPLIMAAIWGFFRVPNDPHDDPAIPVRGWMRLLIEAGFFIMAVVLWFNAGQRIGAVIFAGVIIFHYLISYDRVIWLFKQ